MDTQFFLISNTGEKSEKIFYRWQHKLLLLGVSYFCDKYESHNNELKKWQF